MKVIAHKNKTVLIGYYSTLVLSIICFIFGICLMENKLILVILGVLMLVIIGLLINYYRIPNDIISYDGVDKLYLPNNVILPLNKIEDVSFAISRSKHYYIHKAATIIINTENQNYRLGHVADAAEVVKIILKLVYEHKK